MLKEEAHTTSLRDAYENMPGKAVLKFGGRPYYGSKCTAFEFTVRELTKDHFTYEPRPDELGYQGSTPYRQIVYHGQTPEEVIGAMLHDMAELAWRGHLNPGDPEQKGAPPLQHVMQILSYSLEWHIERRKEQIEVDNSRNPDGVPAPDPNDMRLPTSPRLNRLNEIISGLGTAIAALARIKEL